MKNCIFCKIVHKELSARIVYETDSIVAFHDVHPLAPVHVLIIPKKHICSMNDVTDVDVALIAEMFLAAKTIAYDLNIAESGYKLLIRTGEHGGQEVPHIHLHVIGGAMLAEDIHVM